MLGKCNGFFRPERVEGNFERLFTMNIGGLIGGLVKSVVPSLFKGTPLGGLLGNILPKLDDRQDRSQIQAGGEPSKLSLGGAKPAAAPAAPGGGGFLGALGGIVSKVFPQAAPFVKTLSSLFGG